MADLDGLHSSSGVPQDGHGSPSPTSRRSAHWATAMSRPTSTPVRWKSSVLAPVAMSRLPSQGQVGDDRQVADADRAEAAGQGAERGHDLLRLRRPDVHRAGRVDQLLVRQRVVAAQQHQRQLAVDDLHERLDLPVAGEAVADRQVLDRAHAGRGEPGRACGPAASSIGARADVAFSRFAA